MIRSYSWVSERNHWRNDNERRKPKKSNKTPSNCNFVYHKSHMDWPAFESGPQRWVARESCHDHWSLPKPCMSSVHRINWVYKFGFYIFTFYNILRRWAVSTISATPTGNIPDSIALHFNPLIFHIIPATNQIYIYILHELLPFLLTAVRTLHYHPYCHSCFYIALCYTCDGKAVVAEL